MDFVEKDFQDLGDADNCTFHLPTNDFEKSIRCELRIERCSDELNRVIRSNELLTNFRIL